MKESNTPNYLFFACDTNSQGFDTLLNSLNHLASSYGVAILTFKNIIKSEHSVLDKVEDMIKNSICVVADIGCDPSLPFNTNVAIEIGLAKALNKPLLLISNKPDKVPSNLKGKDILAYPDCITLGTPSYVQLESFFENLGLSFMRGKTVKIFKSKSSEYLDALSHITSLSGYEWFVSPGIRSFFRPLNVELRWLKEVRNYSNNQIKTEQVRRQKRRDLFIKNVNSFGCIDIYPDTAFHLDKWRGMSLLPNERTSFINNIIELLDSNHNYSLAISSEKDNQKYWIKETEYGGFVVFEGWGYVEIREHKEIGGLIMSDPETVNSFKLETEQLLDNSLNGREEVLKLLKALLAEPDEMQ
ncbi:MAG: hypothetical protein SCARUB_02587 [Candidatus Scalindua rubra]|uniref:Nucleoside 2-deoxyribosyltransferase n=1 Tax=Candidatus Scalindua rubra TaxID=1872076 RepID=A0A1E3X9G5_9BACT|nr:MAG: hypothetical protein SCARUB_02587 [Candidatus Scalindua rubra]